MTNLVQMSSVDNKTDYNRLIGPLKLTSKELEKKIIHHKTTLRQAPDDFTIAKETLNLVQCVLKEISNNIIISRVSIKLLNIRNQGALNKARKDTYLILQSFEDILGNEIDTPLSEIGTNLRGFNELISNIERLELYKKIGFLVSTLESVYGEDSKWKWSFVEINGRLTTVFKNFIDFKSLIKNLDPSIEGYNDRLNILEILMEKIEESATLYRNKYELTNKTIDDMKGALVFISLKKRIAILLEESEVIEECNKKSKIWKDKLHKDLSEMENKKSKVLV